MSILATAAAGLVAGLFAWTFLEYALHRFLFHTPGLLKFAFQQHATHHGKVDWFAPILVKARLAIPILPALFVLSWVGGSAAFGGWVVAGVLAGWFYYEALHRRVHRAAPLNAYGRWARRHHLAHHFVDSKMNHGVTTPVWDMLFGTYVATETVTIPKRHAAKFPWLLDGGSEKPQIGEAFVGEYQLS